MIIDELMTGCRRLVLTIKNFWGARYFLSPRIRRETPTLIESYSNQSVKFRRTEKDTHFLQNRIFRNLDKSGTLRLLSVLYYIYCMMLCLCRSGMLTSVVVNNL
jgi:hypothetical protein